MLFCNYGIFSIHFKKILNAIKTNGGKKVTQFFTGEKHNIEGDEGIGGRRGEGGGEREGLRVKSRIPPPNVTL